MGTTATKAIRPAAFELRPLPRVTEPPGIHDVARPSVRGQGKRAVCGLVQQRRRLRSTLGHEHEKSAARRGKAEPGRHIVRIESQSLPVEIHRADDLRPSHPELNIPGAEVDFVRGEAGRCADVRVRAAQLELH